MPLPAGVTDGPRVPGHLLRRDFSFPPDYVDEDDDKYWRGVMDPTRGATKMHEFAKTGTLPGTDKVGYVHTLKDRLELVKYKVLIDWYVAVLCCVCAVSVMWL